MVVLDEEKGGILSVENIICYIGSRFQIRHVN